MANLDFSILGYVEVKILWMAVHTGIYNDRTQTQEAGVSQDRFEFLYFSSSYRTVIVFHTLYMCHRSSVGSFRIL